MVEDSLDFSKVRAFLSSAGRVQLNHDQRENAKQSLAKHMRRFRKINFQEADPDRIEHEIKELEGRISEAIEKEGKIIRHEYDEKSYAMRLCRRIAALEQKLGKVIDLAGKRAQRIKELEDKIARRAGRKEEESEQARHELAVLRKRHMSLAGKKNVRKEKLAEIKTRIDFLENALETG